MGEKPSELVIFSVMLLLQIMCSDKLKTSVLLIFLQLYANSRQIGWFIVSTGMITALPLILEVRSNELLIKVLLFFTPEKMLLTFFLSHLRLSYQYLFYAKFHKCNLQISHLKQIKREIAVEELERIRINMGITEGMSPSQLAQEHGLTSAIDPKVLI